MNFQNIKEWAGKLKRSLNILYRAYMHKKTPWYAKIMIGIVIAYALSPIDLIPDFIPLLGYLDDLLLIPLGVALSLKLIPKDVLKECKENESDKLNIKSIGNYGAFAIVVLWIIIVYLIVKKFI